MLIPKLLWPLQIYEVGLACVEAIEKKISCYTRKWLGLPPGLTSVALYSKTAKLRLPLKAVTEEYKVGKARLQMMLSYSKDASVSITETKLKSGRKWKVSKATEQAIEAAKFKEILGATQTNRQGLGYGSEKRKWWSQVSDSVKRDLVLDEIRHVEETHRVQQAVQQHQQGQWTTWDDALQRSLSWDDIWSMAPLRLSFIIRAMYDQLPTGDNLARWNVTQDVKCALCGGTQTLHHVLSACTEALGSGRYTWRHNQVLRKLLEAVDCARLKANAKEDRSTGRPAAGYDCGFLERATDWRVIADLPNMRAYPEIIKKCNVRPDIVLMSEVTKTAVVIELTVPYESNMSESHEFKLAKYEPLICDLHRGGYKTHMFAVEVGARGLAGASAYNVLKRLGLPGKQRTRYLKQMAEAAEKASHWIWLKRDEKAWTSDGST